MKSCIAIIPAAGSGKRIGGPVAKQFITVNRKPILAYTLEVFERCNLITGIQVVASEEGLEMTTAIIKKYRISKAYPLVLGGKERQDSVYNGLHAIPGDNFTYVAVHDAARPLLNDEVLQQAIKNAEHNGSALVAVPARDTTMEITSEGLRYLDRASLYLVQTPQIFRYRDMLDAYSAAREEQFYGTDESMVMARYRYPVFISPGSSLNFKITTPEDLEIFRQLTNNKAGKK